MMKRLLAAVAFLVVTGLVLGGPAAAQTAPPAEDEEIGKALSMDAKAAEAAITSPKAGVRYLALKKLCEAKYDDKKLIPLLMQGLQDGSVPMKRLAVIELAARKYAPAAKAIYEIILNDKVDYKEDWQLRLVAEASLDRIVDGFPAELKASLLKTEKKQPDGTMQPDPDELKKALEQYKQDYTKRFPK